MLSSADVVLFPGTVSRLVLVDGGTDILIVETVHGFICANAGIDSSNLTETGTVALLPKDSDRSARRIRADGFSGTAAISWAGGLKAIGWKILFSA